MVEHLPSSQVKVKKPVFGYVALAIGVALVGLGVFYFTTNTSFLADDLGRHVTHGAAATVTGIALIAAGIFAMQRARKKVAR